MAENDSAGIDLKRREFLRLSTGSAALALLTAGSAASASACSVQPPKVEDLRSSVTKSSQSAPVIDAHVHLGHPKFKTKPDATDHPFFTLSFDDTVKQLKKEMAESNTRYMFCMPEVTGGAQDPLGIARILALGKQVAGLKAIGFANPERTDRSHLELVERQLSETRPQIVGFKAYLGYFPYAASDPAYVPYIDLAEKYKLPFVFHTGDVYSSSGLLKHAHPLTIDEVAVAHPGVNFVLAHFGCPWYWDAAEVVFKNDNVWADISAQFLADETSMIWPKNQPIDEMLKSKSLPGYLKSYFPMALEWGYDRILYGSDFPIAPMKIYRQVMESIIPPEQHEKVFRTNAERLFGVKCEDAAKAVNS